MTKTTEQGGLIAAKKEALQAQAESKTKNLKEFINETRMQEQIARALPKVITPERFTRIVTTALSTTPKLMECDRNSFIGAMMNAAQLGLEPNTTLGQAYLIPYGKQVQFVLGYKGLIDLAYRSGEVAIIRAETVFKNDEFVYELGFEPKLIHRPKLDGDRGDSIAYYAMFELKNGGKNFFVMTMDDAKKYGQKYSKSFGSGPWQTNFDAMAKKSCLKQVLKYAPIRSEFVEQAISSDDRFMRYESGEILDESNEIFEDENGNKADAETGEIVG